MTEWRMLFYPLGFIAGAAFMARFILQWIQSEKAQQSIVTKQFWRLSLTGNILLALHAFIQLQYHVYLIQCCNAFISLRNLRLMDRKRAQTPLQQSLLLMSLTVLCGTGLFALQDFLFFGFSGNWFHAPFHQWQSSKASSFPMIWHLTGFAGYALFSSRFWVQWIASEQKQESELGTVFWWLSLFGAVLSLIYFASIRDFVNFIGPAFGLLPYIRNLMLIYKKTALFAYEKK